MRTFLPTLVILLVCSCGATDAPPPEPRPPGAALEPSPGEVWLDPIHVSVPPPEDEDVVPTDSYAGYFPCWDVLSERTFARYPLHKSSWANAMDI